jgi:hypothetical protein
MPGERFGREVGETPIPVRAGSKSATLPAQGRTNSPSNYTQRPARGVAREIKDKPKRMSRSPSIWFVGRWGWMVSGYEKGLLRIL